MNGIPHSQTFQSQNVTSGESPHKVMGKILVISQRQSRQHLRRKEAQHTYKHLCAEQVSPADSWKSVKMGAQALNTLYIHAPIFLFHCSSLWGLSSCLEIQENTAVVWDSHWGCEAYNPMLAFGQSCTMDISFPLPTLLLSPAPFRRSSRGFSRLLEPSGECLGAAGKRRTLAEYVLEGGGSLHWMLAIVRCCLILSLWKMLIPGRDVINLRAVLY